MKNSLEQQIFKTIQISVKNALNEMSRVALNKTIDKNLWATVSSACSRNRSTEAEFIKPIGNDKNQLVARYVAALLIMKKPCPETIDDIESIKTFKLVAKKAVELGATLSDIKKLYNENKPGSEPIKNNQNTEQLEDSSSEPSYNETAEEQNSSEDTFGYTFDDDDTDSFTSDINFGDSDIETADMLASEFEDLPKSADIRKVWLLLYGEAKPTAMKYFHEAYKGKYSEFIRSDNSFIRRWAVYQPFYNGVIKKLQNELWTFFESPAITLGSASYGSNIWIDTHEESLKLHKYINSNKRYKLQPHVIADHAIKFLELTKQHKEFVSNILDPYIKNIFETEKSIVACAISPDKGLIMKVESIEDSIGCIKELYGYKSHNYHLTFTGKVNYYKDIKDDKETKSVNKHKVQINSIRREISLFLKKKLSWELYREMLQNNRVDTVWENDTLVLRFKNLEYKNVASIKDFIKKSIYFEVDSTEDVYGVTRYKLRAYRSSIHNEKKRMHTDEYWDLYVYKNNGAWLFQVTFKPTGLGELQKLLPRLTIDKLKILKQNNYDNE